MISLIKGKVVLKDDKKIILLNNDIGYDVFLSSNNLDKIKQGKEESIYTQLVLKEKEIELYGFLSFKELELFKTLKNISGVGAKTALIFADAGSLEKLKIDLENGKIPKGIGKKKLQKILLDLTGKIKEIKKTEDNDTLIKSLKSLGFSQKQIKEAISEIPIGIEDEEVKIKIALQYLGK